jgi:hypothetical protein
MQLLAGKGRSTSERGRLGPLQAYPALDGVAAAQRREVDWPYC